MKKIVSFFCVVIQGICVYAQNLQLHYDFGRTLYSHDKAMKVRPLLTSTVEMLKPDLWGKTYLFVDMDYTSEGVASAYWEISRELKFWKRPLLVHLEYNGGLNYIKNAFLVGPTYAYDSNGFLYGISLSVMYKYIQKCSNPHSFQLTGVWYWHFAKGKCTFSGFADWWKERNTGGNYIFVSEPQFWINLNRFKGVNPDLKLSVGSEVELCHNLGGRKGFYAIPTLAIKWSFDK